MHRIGTVVGLAVCYILLSVPFASAESESCPTRQFTSSIPAPPPGFEAVQTGVVEEDCTISSSTVSYVPLESEPLDPPNLPLLLQPFVPVADSAPGTTPQQKRVWDVL